MYVKTVDRSVRIGCATVVAAALTVAVAPPQPERIQVPVASHVVQLQALAVSAAANSSELTAAITPNLQPTDVPSAAAIGDGNVVEDIVRTVASLAAVAVLPLWWIAAPITLPVSFILANNLFGGPIGSGSPNPVTGFAAGFVIAATLGFVIGGPVALANGIVDLLFPSQPTTGGLTVAAAASAASRTAATEESAAATEPLQHPTPAQTAAPQVSSLNTDGAPMSSGRSEAVRMSGRDQVTETLETTETGTPAARATNRSSRVSTQSPKRSEIAQTVGAASATAPSSTLTDGATEPTARAQVERKHRGDVKRSAR